jgi:hypothetical protein
MGPSDEKAYKTYKHALEALRGRRQDIALDEFKKADKQDGGHCRACQKPMIKYGMELGEWKTAELAADEMIAEATDAKEVVMVEFIGKNEMTWPQYRDGGFTGSIAKMFGVTPIPHTFTIDADGFLRKSTSATLRSKVSSRSSWFTLAN